MYQHDKRIVLTLDAGGTNFVFSAIQGCKELLEPIHLAAVTDHTEKCLQVLVEGFSQVMDKLDEAPVAISFAFPGPADYEHGIIGDLPNFPSFRGGVALGPFLAEKFGVPVFINNDGNLFAYGEALAGSLPAINQQLKAHGCDRRYKNLIGVTLGTGFGAGVVIDGKLLTGDNGCGGDLWLMRNKRYPELIAEESVSIRAIRRVYGELAQTDASMLTPKDIFDIAEGAKTGNPSAAIAAFEALGEMAGAAIVNALNIVDGIVTIGGGVSGAAKYIMPRLMMELKAQLKTFGGDSFPCLQMDAYNLTDQAELTAFLEGKDLFVQVPMIGRQVRYVCEKKIGVTLSELGASRAIALGAYTFALAQLDNNR
ncbi:MAG: ROK family protein [Bacteroidaceae bacterium]|nr:ROK family protein [Bacteroidaceae bacterium]